MAQGRAGPSEKAERRREDTGRHGLRPIYVCKGRLRVPPLPREAV
jgi:hypothetical protein